MLSKNIKNAQILAKNAPNTTKPIPRKKKEKMREFKPKKHLTLPYKSYGKKKNEQIRAKRST